MFNKSKKTIKQETILYNNILVLSRNKLFFTKFNFADTFQNRIYLIFLHISFLFIKIRQNSHKEIYKVFNQRIFDLIFSKIELDMREIGYGDTVINKNMKFLIKNFYNILLKCENFSTINTNLKVVFFSKYLVLNKANKNDNYTSIIDYFNKYQAFCFDLSLDSVLKGDLNFNYK